MGYIQSVLVQQSGKTFLVSVILMLKEGKFFELSLTRVKDPNRKPMILL